MIGIVIAARGLLNAARTLVQPAELPVGVLTGIIGGGLFVFALLRRQGREGQP